MRTFNYIENLQLQWEPSIIMRTFHCNWNLQLLWELSVIMRTFNYYGNLQLLWEPLWNHGSFKKQRCLRSWIFSNFVFDPVTFACLTLPFLGLLNKKALKMVRSGFKKSVQSKNDSSIKKSLRKIYFSRKKVDTLLKIALFQIKCIFTTVAWEK